ncbi:MAG TPA: threonine/serine dehydratase [Longimicrobiales bacterium]
MNLVDKQDIERAATSIRGVAARTPLVEAHWLSDKLGYEVRLKCENLQRAGAFKIRGAYTAIARLPESERKRGVITYSSGNHGQAVALAARIFGIKAVVVMPTTAPPIKVSGAKKLGAEVVLEGTTSTERHARAMQLAQAHGYVVIPPFDDPDIIAGQGTVALEILQDLPGTQAVLVPIGGGGLLSGVAAYIKQTQPNCQVIGVEPEVADAMYQSRKAGEPVTIKAQPTIADGLMPVRPGDLTYAHASQFVDEIVRVPDDAIINATRELIQNAKLIVEFSGAATVAALLAHAWQPAQGPVVAILSGGNLDPSRMRELVD